MKRLLLAATLLVPIAAHAGGNENGNGCRNRCGDSTGGGTTSSTSNAVSASISNADAAARANATGGNARAYGGSARATGGTVSPTFNINVPTSSSDPAPTKAALAAPASASATAPTSVTGGSYTGSYAGEYYGGNTTVSNNSNVDARSAPAVVVPSIGGGGSDCPVVGFGVGGSGIGGGGGFGPSWLSTKCDHRRKAELIYQLTGDGHAALSYLASVEDDVADWMKARATPVAAVAPVAVTAPAAKPEWCYTASASERARHMECR